MTIETQVGAHLALQVNSKNLESFLGMPVKDLRALFANSTIQYCMPKDKSAVVNGVNSSTHEIFNIEFNPQDFTVSLPDGNVPIEMFIEDAAANGVIVQIVPSQLAQNYDLPNEPESKGYRMLLLQELLAKMRLNTLAPAVNGNIFEYVPTGRRIAIKNIPETAVSSPNIYSDLANYSNQSGVWAFQNQILQTIGVSAPHFKNIAVVSPTGSGKTIMQSEVTRAIMQHSADGVGLFVCPLIEITNETYRKYTTKVDPNAGVFHSARKTPVLQSTGVIATTYKSLPELTRQLEANGVRITHAHLDEAHTLLAKGINVDKLLPPDVQKFGWTATDGKDRTLEDLGFVTVYKSRVAEGIAEGYLAPVRVTRYIAKNKEITKKVVAKAKREKVYADEAAIDSIIEPELYSQAAVSALGENCLIKDDKGKIVDVKKTIVEAVDTHDAKNNIYPRILAVLPPHLHSAVAVVSSHISPKKNQEIFEKARNGTVKVLIHVRMIGMGVDLPMFKTLIMRPKKRSEFSTEQMLGRILRIYNNEIAHAIEILPDLPRSPESMGYETVLSVLGISESSPKVVFYGNKQKYAQEVQRSKHDPKQYILPQIKRPADRLVDYLVSRREDAGKWHDPKLRVVSTEQELLGHFETRLKAKLITAKSIDGLFILKTVGYNNKETRSFEQDVNHEYFFRLFGLYLVNCMQKFPNTLQVLVEACKNLAIVTPLDKVSTLPALLGTIFELKNAKPTLAIAELALKTKSNPVVLDIAAQGMFKAGQMHQDFSKATNLVEAAAVQKILSKSPANIVFNPLDLEIAAVGQLENYIHLMAGLMRTNLEQHINANPSAYGVKVPDFFAKIWQDYYSKLRIILKNSTRLRKGSTSVLQKVVSAADASNYVYAMCLREAMDLEKKLTQKTSQHVMAKESKTNMAEYADNILKSKNIKTPTDFNFRDVKAFANLFGMSYTNFAAKVRALYGQTVEDFLCNYFEQYDQDFKWSNMLYRNAATLEEFMARAAVYVAQRGPIAIEQVTPDNFYNVFPPKCNSMPQSGTPYKGTSRMQFRSTAAKFGLTASEFCQELNKHLGLLVR